MPCVLAEAHKIFRESAVYQCGVRENANRNIEPF